MKRDDILKPQQRKRYLAKILQQHGRAIYQSAFRLLGHQDLSEDVVQEVFLKLYRSKTIDIQTIKHWRNYLKSMAVSLAYDQLKARRRQPTTRVDNAPIDNESIDIANMVDSNTPERQLSNQQDIAQLRIALTHLNKQDYQVFTLRFIEELSYQEIADQLQISRNLVGVILHRSQKKLTQLLPSSITGACYVTP